MLPNALSTVSTFQINATVVLDGEELDAQFKIAQIIAMAMGNAKTELAFAALDGPVQLVLIPSARTIARPMDIASNLNVFASLNSLANIANTHNALPIQRALERVFAMRELVCVLKDGLELIVAESSTALTIVVIMELVRLASANARMGGVEMTAASKHVPVIAQATEFASRMFAIASKDSAELIVQLNLRQPPKC